MHAVTPPVGCWKCCNVKKSFVPERLIPKLFVREDAVEAAWAIVDPSSRMPQLCINTSQARGAREPEREKARGSAPFAVCVGDVFLHCRAHAAAASGWMCPS